jgi:flagellar hook protein FlgE
MLRSLNTAVSGLHYQQNRLDIIGNNIANVNTTGFRASRANAADTFSQTLAGFNGSAGQVGSGVALSGTTRTNSQGVIATTGQPYDMAIEGDGFFIVRDPNGGGSFATRAGDFRIDSTTGHLTTSGGLRVQGLDAAGQPGDIQISLTPGTPPGSALPANTRGVSWRVEQDGSIMLTLANTNGTTPAPAPLRLGQIQLQRFRDPNAMTAVGSNLFGNLDAAGGLAAAAPNSNGLGYLRWQALEQANVDLAGQFTDLIVTQRGYQANSKIVTTSDEILQELINLKR